MEPPAAGAGAGGSSGGEAGGTAGAAGTLSPPVVDPSVSAEYRWEECGRIPGAVAQLRQALYASDGSILALNELGEIRLYGLDPSAPTSLVGPAGAVLADVGMALSGDGKLLLTWRDALVDVYARDDGQPIGADSKALVPVARVDQSSTACAGKVAFSSDATLVVGRGADTVCLWELETGELISSISMPSDSSLGTLAGVANGPAPVRVLHESTLFTYTLAGEVVDTFDLTALFPRGRGLATVLSTDAATLLTLVSPGATGTPFDLVATATETGVERWRAPVSNSDAYFIMLSNDRHALVEGAGVYRVEDGVLTSSDAPSTPSRTMDLSAERRTKLVLGEFVAEWDLTDGTVTTLYGSHTAAVRALDVSRDGRYFASHGTWAVLWELGASFATSRPLAQGQGSNVSWNVAIAPDGSGMVASGDNVAYFGRDGRRRGTEIPPPSSVECFSPDWAFSPVGDLVAGANYASVVMVRNSSDFTYVRGLASKNCGGGVAFSPDGALLATASLELFETANFTHVWDLSSLHARPTYAPAEYAVEFSPDAREIAITRCSDPSPGPCTSERYATVDGTRVGGAETLEGDRVRYSPEGHWLVSSNRALHLPSGDSLEFDPAAHVSAFTPDGDIIAGVNGGALVHYCRTGE
jgi:WD40 repeat protein